jgi:MoxR-like ATPase
MSNSIEKIQSLTTALYESGLDIGRGDLVIRGENYNSQLYFSIANACLSNKMLLLFGGMGANKTTLLNILSSRFQNIPYNEAAEAVITGHPEQTEEKIIGFMDPRQWTRDGDIEVLWTKWALSPWKTINEINRFPQGKQNIFIELIKKREVVYAGITHYVGDCRYFATMNPDFKSTYPLDEALLDRISACTPAYQPAATDQIQLLGRSDDIETLVDSLPSFTTEEFNELPRKIAAIELDFDTQVAIVALVKDFSLCIRAPNYDKTQLLQDARPRSGLCSIDQCHYHENPQVLCWQTDEGLSQRTIQDLRDYTKAFTYLTGEEHAIEVLRSIAPYIIWHRITPNESVYKKPPYYGANKLQFTKELVNKSINRTLNERRSLIKTFLEGLKGKNVTDTLNQHDDLLAKCDFAEYLHNKH